MIIRRSVAVIQLQNVSKFYYSKGMIASGFSRVNLEFDIGEFVVITGESGSGKTTLLNVISGLDSYEEGEMYIDGKETSHYLASDFEKYRKRYIGNIFQNFNLVNSYTVYENIELILLINGYSRQEIRKRVPDIIEKVGLTPYTRTKVSKLSGGQKQRVSIARALAKDTEIIVADEPTGNLDSRSADDIVRLLSEIAKDKLVIVVTHNYEQFAPYVTRKIKMHDGKVVEDEKIRSIPEAVMEHAEDMYEEAREKAETEEAGGRGSISAGNIIRLGVRNTFNIVPKFILLFIVFIFVAGAVSSEYTTFRHQDEEASKLGYNDYFYNYSEDRMVLKKKDDSQFTDDDMRILRSVAGVEKVEAADILLDSPLYIEEGDFSYEVYPLALESFEGDLVEGEMPQAENEAIFSAYSDDYYMSEDMRSDIIGKDYRVYVGEDKEITIRITGIAYKESNDSSAYMYGGDIYLSSPLMASLMEETYNYNSTITTTINGKAQVYAEGSSLYRIVPNSKVAPGSAVVSEEVNNFYSDGKAGGKTINVKAENIYYTESVDLKISDVYNKNTFRSKTGMSDFDGLNGTVYVSQADYDRLFKKGNYQVSVYAQDPDQIKELTSSLENMGYVTLPLKDTLMTYGSDMVSIIQVPVAVVIVVAVFFIAYFVIRLILRSRSGYFSILRMLGMAGNHIRRILDAELFTVMNIAYAVFVAVMILVNMDVISVGYVKTLAEYMSAGDYIVLYLIIALMTYLISGKFIRSLFRKTAMESYREEE